MDAAVREATEATPLSESKPRVTNEARATVRCLFWLRRNLVFVLTVVVPTCCAVAYYGFVASDIYISESRFIVRSPDQRTQVGLVGQILQGTGISHSQDDTYAVRDFILSRDALKELDAKLALRAQYEGERIDFFNRFPGIYWNDSFESFYRYYTKHVAVEYDPTSSIATLTVRGFTPQGAYKTNQLLLEMSERLVNGLNDRSRRDLVKFAEREVELAAQKARDASLAMLAFRRGQSVYEPNKQAEIQLEGVARLQAELISTEAELAQLKTLSPTNPQIVGLESRADTLRSAISKEASKVTTGPGSLSARAPTFERLALESTFADKELGEALAELQTARSDAARQQLYLDRLVAPNLPDYSMEPRRTRWIFTVFLVGLMAWGVMSLVLASIREHAD